jgi:hypothetical protein
MKYITLIFGLLLLPKSQAFIKSIRGPRSTRLFNVNNEDNLDAGEVSWEAIPFTQYSVTGLQNLISDTIAPIPITMPECAPTPLYKKVKNDQIRLASASVVTKMSYKEFFNIDLFLSQLNSNISTHTLFTPTEMFLLTILSGIAFTYNKTKETEAERLQKLYKYESRAEYFEKYKKIRKITMMAFIVLTSVFTRNVLIAE